MTEQHRTDGSCPLTTGRATPRAVLGGSASSQGCVTEPRAGAVQPQETGSPGSWASPWRTLQDTPRTPKAGHSILAAHWSQRRGDLTVLRLSTIKAGSGRGRVQAFIETKPSPGDSNGQSGPSSIIWNRGWPTMPRGPLARRLSSEIKFYGDTATLIHVHVADGGWLVSLSGCNRDPGGS